MLSALQTLQTPPQYDMGEFAQLLGIQLDLTDSGKVIGRLDVKKHLLNRHGIAHGGVPYTLIDTVSGASAIHTLGRPTIVTQDLHYRYHGPARIGQIWAEAVVIHQGRRTMVTRGEIYQGEVLIGSATGTFAIISADQFKDVSPQTATSSPSE